MRNKLALVIPTFVGILLASVLACNNAEPDPLLDRAQVELDKHRGLWEQTRSDDYTYEYSVLCECPDHTSQTVKVTVMDGDIESVVSTGFVESAIYTKSGGPMTKLPSYHTLDRFFDVIQEAITGEAEQLNVSYHSELGYPTKVKIDYTVNAIDDEYTLTAKAYSPR